MFVDSHCHLSFPELSSRLAEIRSAMVEARVTRALCICTTLEEFDRVHALAIGYDNFWCTVGVHPDNLGVREPAVSDLTAMARRPRVVAIGETGLDYYRLEGRSIADMEWQRERFRVHIRAARIARLPLVIHTRNAGDDTLAIVAGEGGADVGGVFHCFTEALDVARAALDMDFHISFSGILTFRNAKALHDVARFVPLGRTLIETDSPYLAPVPFRGKLNMPAYVPEVARKLAEIKGLSIAAVADATTRNFERLFAIPSEQAAEDVEVKL
jgi:TatD DNase family protein